MKLITPNMELFPVSLNKAPKCEDCNDTGWYGDNGPGRKDNREYHPCDSCGKGQDVNPCCPRCKEYVVLMQEDVIGDSMISWNPAGPHDAKTISSSRYDIAVIFDRGYLRLVDTDEAQCLDHGQKVKLNYCPWCGRKITEE